MIRLWGLSQIKQSHVGGNTDPISYSSLHCLPFSVFSYLSLLIFSNVGKVTWAAVTYVIMSMLSTAFNIPVLSLMPTLTKNPKERSALATCQTFFTTLAVVLGSTFAYPLIKLLGGGSETSNLAKWLSMGYGCCRNHINCLRLDDFHIYQRRN